MAKGLSQILSLSFEFHLDTKADKMLSVLGGGTKINQLLEYTLFSILPLLSDLLIVSAINYRFLI